MKKSVRSILGLGTALVVLGGGYAFMKLTEPEENPETVSNEENHTETEGAGIILIGDSQAEDGQSVVSKVDVKNSTDELHVVMNTPKTEESNATYTLEGYQDLQLDTSLVATLANNANNLSSEALIQQGKENLEKFGLENPETTVKVTFETGTEKTMYIGNKAPVGSACYVMVDDIDAVFTVRNSALANYSKTLFDFVEDTVLEAPEQSAYPIVNTLKIEREDIDYDILLEYDEKSNDEGYSSGTSATHVMVEPTSAYLAVERSTDIVTGMFGLSAKNIYSVHCGESDIAETGLKEPFCRVTMSTTDGDYILLLSEPFTDDDNEKCCYAMLEGGNTIYIVKAENAKWVTVKPIDIASRIFIGTYVWNVNNLTVSDNQGDSAEFSVTMKDSVEDENSLTAEDFDTTLNGSEFDSERYRKFYSYLISANAEEFALDTEIPDSEPMVTVSYDDTYSDEHRDLSFYDYSNLTALITVNGESKFFVAKSYVETLIKNLQILQTDDDFITTWK